MHVTLCSPCIYKRGRQGPFQGEKRWGKTHTPFDSSRASALHLHILRPGSSSLSHQLVISYYKHLGARQYKTLLSIGRRAFFGLNQYKSLVFLHTIRISDAQTLINSSGLGPLVQTPTPSFTSLSPYLLLLSSRTNRHNQCMDVLQTMIVCMYEAVWCT
jgi:hypothetical protein